MSNSEEQSKKAIVRKAILVAFGVFFFGVVLFVGIVLVVARLAQK